MSHTPGYIFRKHTAIIAIIATCTVVFLSTGSDVSVARTYGARPLLVRHAFLALLEGDIVSEVLLECTTVVTTIFLHGGMSHLLYNMLYLWIFGFAVAEVIGQRWMVSAFLLCGVAGAITHCCLNKESIAPLIGASGSVMGLEGLYLGMALRWRLPDPDVWPLAYPIRPERLAALGVIGLVFDYWAILQHAQTNVAYGAHVGGFVVGAFLGSIVVPRPKGMLNKE